MLLTKRIAFETNSTRLETRYENYKILHVSLVIWSRALGIISRKNHGLSLQSSPVELQNHLFDFSVQVHER